MSYVTLLPDAPHLIRQRRLDQGLSLEYLADQCGCSVKTLQLTESGRRQQVRDVWLSPLCSVLKLEARTLVAPTAVRAKNRLTSQSGDHRTDAGDPSAEPYDAFLAAAMAGAGSAYPVENARVLEVLAQLRTACGWGRVYYAGDSRPTPDDFEDEGVALNASVKALDSSQRFVLIYPKRRATSALIELGYALARRIPSVICVRRWGDLPYLLRSPERVLPYVHVVRYRHEADIAPLVADALSI